MTYTFSHIEQIGEGEQRKADRLFITTVLGVPVILFLGWFVYTLYTTNTDIFNQ